MAVDNGIHVVGISEPGRFERRFADGAVNSHLLQAAVLATGWFRTLGDGFDIGVAAPTGGLVCERSVPPVYEEACEF